MNDTERSSGRAAAPAEVCSDVSEAQPQRGVRRGTRDDLLVAGASGASAGTNRSHTIKICLGLVLLAALAHAVKAGVEADAAMRAGLHRGSLQPWPAGFISFAGLVLALPVAAAVDRVGRSPVGASVRASGVLLGSMLFSLVYFATLILLPIALHMRLDDAFGFIPERDWLNALTICMIAYACALGAFALGRGVAAAGPANPVGEGSWPPQELACELPKPRPISARFADGTRQVDVDLSTICAVAGGGNYVELIHRSGARTMLRTTLLAAEAALMPAGFERTHKSWLVRLEEVRAVERTPAGDYRLILGDGIEAPLSRRNRALLNEIGGPPLKVSATVAAGGAAA
jgi:hypothetical protein